MRASLDTNVIIHLYKAGPVVKIRQAFLQGSLQERGFSVDPKHGQRAWNQNKRQIGEAEESFVITE